MLIHVTIGRLPGPTFTAEVEDGNIVSGILQANGLYVDISAGDEILINGTPGTGNETPTEGDSIRVAKECVSNSGR